MKKTFNILIILTTILFLSMILSCNSNQLPTENNSIYQKESLSKSSVEDCGPITEVLYAAQDFEAGYVLIDNDEDNLYVTVYSDNGYQDKEEQIKMWFGNDLIDLPQTKKGNLKIGHFPFKITVDPNEKEYTFTLSLDELDLNCDDQLYVVVHADVLLTDSQRRVRNESAFGGIAEGMFGSQWWYYMSYTICCEIPNTPPIADFTITPESGGSTATTFSFDGSSSTDNEDATPLLQVRWDWTNDGTYDTDYNTIQLAEHLFTIAGTYTVKMEVKDTGGLTNTTTKIVTVEQGAFVVTFPDPNFEAVIREELNKQTGDITNLDMETITRLDGDYSNITDISGIEYCLNIIYLYLHGNQISDIKPLSDLVTLRVVGISSNQITDISPINNLMNLYHLSIFDNQISDISVLSNLTTSLISLNMEVNQISDLSPIAGLTKLQYLYISRNPISDISALSGLVNLEYWLDISNTQISDISALSGMIKLKNLFLGNTQISDISPLSTLTNMTQISLSQNNISDISALSNMSKLYNLYIGENNISDISGLAGLISLTSLYIANNQINDLTPLSTAVNIEWMNLSDNLIVDISPLSALLNINTLFLTNNQVVDIYPLTVNLGIGSGDDIYLYSNPLDNISINTYVPELKARGVNVYGF